MGRILAFIYGVVSYGMFLGAFGYAIAFVGDFWVPKTINSGEPGAFLPALLINAGLLSLFAVQHSGMARPGFKKWWTKIVPEPIERSTYVLLASGVLFLLYWQWQPLPAPIWSVENEIGRWILWGLFGLGWGLVVYTTFLISHAHLFGLTQVRDFMKDRDLWEPKFQTPNLYSHMRHPMMLGFFFAFWAIPEMTVGHLVFSIATTGYILVALQLEERDLIQAFGDRYRKYRKEVPMFIPRAGQKSTVDSKEQNTELLSQPFDE
ncbi:methanethiol S-methyltransferase [Fodinibius salsisoli]|uniref:methanethiol S-methyltransferase n=1 Tax=Fodinibius salsisoli TaxID=2820877 RepID=A0ABT3PJJ3_9BACT|nr:methanethiol S-methyltransferase [Fodinibius salsisoli]MCW9706114.1 isoprenylcysteine carboxylmethyltransferase family protein [Fodinibius salsisoli]